MEHKGDERLGLRSEKMRRLVGNIPVSVYLASIVVVVLSVVMLAVLVLIFDEAILLQ